MMTYNLEEIPVGAPFMMALINTKAVHRSNQLLNYAYGRDFVYDEMMMTGSGPEGEKRAKALVRREAVQNALIKRKWPNASRRVWS